MFSPDKFRHVQSTIVIIFIRKYCNFILQGVPEKRILISPLGCLLANPTIVDSPEIGILFSRTTCSGQCGQQSVQLMLTLSRRTLQRYFGPIYGRRSTFRFKKILTPVFFMVEWKVRQFWIGKGQSISKLSHFLFYDKNYGSYDGLLWFGRDLIFRT